MASLYSTGPALTYIGMGLQNTPTYLGTFERKPKITITPAFTPVMNDLGGSEVPLDRVYQGKEGQVSGIMNRFNMPVMRALMAAPRRPGVVALPNAQQELQGDGSDLGQDYGSLMTQESLGFGLWVLFPRNQLPGMLAAGLIAGYHFLSSFLLGPHDIEAGSGDYKQSVIFQCQRQIVVGSTALNTTLNLYDHQGLNTLPAIN